METGVRFLELRSYPKCPGEVSTDVGGDSGGKEKRCGVRGDILGEVQGFIQCTLERVETYLVKGMVLVMRRVVWSVEDVDG